MSCSRRAMVAVILLGPVGGSDADNILTNAGLESGDFTGWTVVSETRVAARVSDLVSYSGDYALRFFDNGTGDGEAEARQTFTPVATSDVTEVSVWFLLTDAYEAVCYFKLGYSDGTSESIMMSLTPNDWQQVDATSLLDSGKSLEYIAALGFTGVVPLGNPNAPPTPGLMAAFDDFVVSTVPAPGSLALLAIGTVLAAFRPGRARSFIAS